MKWFWHVIKWFWHVIQRLLRIPAIIVGIVIMFIAVLTYPLWFIFFGAGFDDVIEGASDIFSFLMDCTDPNHDWDYNPPPDGW